MYLHLGSAVTASPFRVTHDQYFADRAAETRGTANPSIMDKPFWKYMIARGMTANDARLLLKPKEGTDLAKRYDYVGGLDWSLSPVWCFWRFGCTLTVLPDGRYVHIGGEHEERYDPDSWIYNGQVTLTGIFWGIVL